MSEQLPLGLWKQIASAVVCEALSPTGIHIPPDEATRWLAALADTETQAENTTPGTTPPPAT